MTIALIRRHSVDLESWARPGANAFEGLDCAPALDQRPPNTMTKRKGKKLSKARQSLDRVIERADAEFKARQKARPEELAAKGRLYWPYFVGTPEETIVADFLEHWTPELVLKAWQREVAALGIVPAAVVQTIPVWHATLLRERLGPEAPIAGWWP
jgi:spore cortex formation protein SpoVR/YcgB (stage V sporulation)